MSSPLLSAFLPEVTGFKTAAFALGEDLTWLDQLRGIRASVGVVFHASRILEVLARRAQDQAGLAGAGKSGEDAPKLHHVLLQLFDYNHVGKEPYWLFGRLRDLGNKVRHAEKRVSDADADQGYAIALRSVQWYFCEFPGGPKLATATVYNRPLDDLLPADAAALLHMLRSDEIHGRGFLQSLRLNDPNCPLLVSPVLAAVMVERLLDAGKRDEAQAVLTAALPRMPDDVRLRQLQGLAWSRAGKLEEACALLEAVGPTDSAADEETRGILAGAYKRRATAEPEKRDEWLKRSGEMYAEGWKRSGKANTYLGINAAAMGLWQGKPKYESVAWSVREAMLARKRSLAPRHLTLWDELTLAEAHLLLRDFEAAKAAYRETATRHPHEAGALGGARSQAEKDLEKLGRADLAAWMFAE